jgi:hypothetical protein
MRLGYSVGMFYYSYVLLDLLVALWVGVFVSQ